MMLALTIIFVSFFISMIQASPLMMRDVFSPHITSPNENTIWPVGTKQTVTWETDDIPPDSQLTNPNGKVVLGHLGPTGGLNLDLDHPLAENFKLRVGQVEITVPSVTPRDDYIIVLFGDSGNASPAFAITRITSGESTTTKPNSTTTASHKATSSHASSSSASIVFTDPIPITGTTITGGVSSSTGSSSTATTVASALTTASTTPASSTSSSPANTASAANAATTSNSAMPQSKAYTTLASFGVASLLITLLV